MLKHWYHKGDTATWYLYTTRWVMQSITPIETFTCSGATLFLSKYGTPAGTLTYSFYAADGSGNPTGVALATGTCDYANAWGYGVSAGAIKSPFRVVFDIPVVLTVGTQYALVANLSGGGAANALTVWYQAAGDYAGGQMKTSTNGGGTWTNTAYDLMFDLWDDTADGSTLVAADYVGSARRLIQIHRGTLGSTITGTYGFSSSYGLKFAKTSNYLYVGAGSTIRRFDFNLVEDTVWGTLAAGGSIKDMDVSEEQDLLVYATAGSGANYGVFDISSKTKLWSASASLSFARIHPTQDIVMFGYSPGSGGSYCGYRYVASTGASIFNFWVSAINLTAGAFRVSNTRMFVVNSNSGGQATVREHNETDNTYRWQSSYLTPKAGVCNEIIHVPDDLMLYMVTNRNATGQRSLYSMSEDGVQSAAVDLGGHGLCVTELNDTQLLVGSYSGSDGTATSSLRIVRKSDLVVQWRFDPDLCPQIDAADVLIIDYTMDFTVLGRGEILVEAVAGEDPSPVDDVVLPSDESDIVSLPPMAYRPEAPMVEQLLFRTQINRSLDGYEERVSLRKCPRISFEWKISEEENRQLVENVLFGSAMDWMGAPFWHEPVYLTTQLSAGDDHAHVTSTVYSQFLAGQWALAISPSGASFDLLKVVTVGANLLTFDNLPQHDYKVKWQILPVSRCVAESIVVTKRMNHALYDMKVLVEPVDNDLGLQPYTPGELVITDVNYVENLKETFEKPCYRQDAPYGLFEQTSVLEHADKGSQLGFITHSREELWELRKLLYRLGGRYVPFFLATFGKELTPAATLTSGQSTLTIVACGYTDYIQSRRGKLRIVLTDGTVIDRTVVSSVNISSSVERITVNESWETTVTTSEIDRIEYMDLVRFDSDDITIEHQNALGNATCQVPVKFVYYETDTVVGNPQGLLLSLTYAG